MFFNDEANGQDEQDSYPDHKGGGLPRRSHSIKRFVLISSYDTWTKRKRKTTRRSFSSQSTGNLDIENPLQNNEKDMKEIVEFWDYNGFGFSNINAKQQLLTWLDDSSFLQPKEVILKTVTNQLT